MSADPHALPSPPALAPRRTTIGVFDSGVGGLSVLRAIHAQLPGADLVYLADSGHAPYGDRDEDWLRDRADRIADFLLAQGAQLLVIACNTATAAAAASLRARLPHVPVVGVEPGIKPALASSLAHRIGVLATTRTLQSNKFRALAQAHAGDATLVLQPCPGLADAVETAADDEPLLKARVAQYAQPLREAGVDTVVLGCTHYAFARDLVQAQLPGVMLVDTADAVARQTARLAAGLPPSAPGASGASGAQGDVVVHTTGDPAVMQRFLGRWWPGPVALRSASL